MELRHLRYFAAVAETRHFGRAAEQLHMAQPALSQSIRQLEAELGTPLFTRTTRQVRLTPAGEYLRGEAQRVLASVDEAVHGVRRIADGRQGLVRIAFTGSATYAHLPRIARVLKQELPGLALEVHADMLTGAQVEGLVSGSLDVGLLRPPTSDPTIRLRTLEREPMVLAVAVDHRLANEPVVSMADLRAEEFVLFSDDSSVVNDAVIRSCHEAGFSPHGDQVAESVAVMLPLVAAGLGIAVVPGSVRTVPFVGVAFRDVTDVASLELALAWRDDDSPSVRNVLDVLEAAGLFPEATPTHEVAR